MTECPYLTRTDFRSPDAGSYYASAEALAVNYGSRYKDVFGHAAGNQDLLMLLGFSTWFKPPYLGGQRTFGQRKTRCVA